MDMEIQINLDKIRKKLERQQNVLSARVEEEKDKAAPGSVANPDRADLAHDYSYRARHISMIDQLEAQLEETGMALERIEEGIYGRCTKCGNFIIAARLEAMPAAELCIRCRRQEE